VGGFTTETWGTLVAQGFRKKRKRNPKNKIIRVPISLPVRRITDRFLFGKFQTGDKVL